MGGSSDGRKISGEKREAAPSRLPSPLRRTASLCSRPGERGERGGRIQLKGWESLSYEARSFPLCIYLDCGNAVQPDELSLSPLFLQSIVEMPCNQEKVFVVHGGLFPHDGVTLNHIRGMSRKREPPIHSTSFEDQVSRGILFSCFEDTPR